MANFIDEFLKKEIEKNSYSNKNQEQEFITGKENINNDFISLESENLENNKNKKMGQSNKGQIVIEKNDYKKTILWIFAQIVIGVLLIIYSYSYLQTHEAERKFFDSSISYWKSIAVKLYSSLGGDFTKQIDEDYIDKRATMVRTLSSLSIELDACIAREKDRKTTQELKKTKQDIEQLKLMLSNTDYLPLKKYIDKYQYYSLWVNSLKEGVENYCRK